ncbi:MAG: [FeFe] hydrogenase H-cluster maturation GTPase HydF [Lachnospiraceae bacterium]|jgi:[FeFe] hydrogenase H-cluster maturation GTPase HydF|nr:[FeFe] hydrogenase H-cluster maturation GTPase HydF [Lachnospiraceae bacterium]
MGLNSTPSAERVHIGIFGKRNAGKSSVINAMTGQSLAIVSDVKGTTTDPVSKAMELLPLGPVVMIDTPGIDDEGELGALRVKKSYQVLNKTDIAVLVVDAVTGMTQEDEALLERIRDKQIPYVLVYNKKDLVQDFVCPQKNSIAVSSETGENVRELKELIAAQRPEEVTERRIVGDLLSPSDFAVLVVPIDKAAPKGRLILPQQQTIRDILESGGTAIVVRERELGQTLEDLAKKPRMVITDSQVFAQVSRNTPEDIMLTSFSILFARYKGELQTFVEGVRAVEELTDGDQVLICEGCTHHRQCEDIGTVKLPGWLQAHTGKKLRFTFTSGVEFPEDLSRYRLIVHCGACTLNEREVKYRIACARDAGIPMTNYGILIAYVQGILRRSVQAFPEVYRLL